MITGFRNNSNQPITSTQTAFNTVDLNMLIDFESDLNGSGRIRRNSTQIGTFTRSNGGPVVITFVSGNFSQPAVHGDVFSIITDVPTGVPTATLTVSRTRWASGAPKISGLIREALKFEKAGGNEKLFRRSYQQLVLGRYDQAFDYKLPSRFSKNMINGFNDVFSTSINTFKRNDSFYCNNGLEKVITPAEILGNDFIRTGGNVVLNVSTLRITSVSNPVGCTIRTTVASGRVTAIYFLNSIGIGQRASFDCLVQNTSTLETFTVNVGVFVKTNHFEYSPSEAYIFSGSELTSFINSYTPPSQTTIFNTWDRFSNNGQWYPSGVTPQNEATAWELVGGSLRNTTNSSFFTGIVSPSTYSNYTFQASLASTSNDDDTVAIVLAFKRDNSLGRNYALMAIREPGGNIGFTGGNTAQGIPGRGWSIYLHVGTAPDNNTNGSTAGSTIIRLPTVFDSYKSVAGWGTLQPTTVRAIRQGNNLTVQCTPWNGTTTFAPDSLMTLDLTSDSRLEPFLGAASYGYAASSQQFATWSNVTFDGGENLNQIFDFANNRVYNWSGTAWVLQPVSTTIQSILGFPRVVTNPNNNRVYLIEQNSITQIA
jgi:hypothetical protein